MKMHMDKQLENKMKRRKKSKNSTAHHQFPIELKKQTKYNLETLVDQSYFRISTNSISPEKEKNSLKFFSVAPKETFVTLTVLICNHHKQNKETVTITQK